MERYGLITDRSNLKSVTLMKIAAPRIMIDAIITQRYATRRSTPVRPTTSSDFKDLTFPF